MTDVLFGRPVDPGRGAVIQVHFQGWKRRGEFSKRPLHYWEFAPLSYLVNLSKRIPSTHKSALISPTGCKRYFDPLSLFSVLWYQQNQMISVAHFPKETVQSSNDGHTVFVENNDHASRTRRTFNDPMLQLLSYYVDVFLMNNLRRRGSYM